MAIPVVVQTPNAVLVSGASSANVALGSAVTPGNALVGCVTFVGTAARTWDVTDTVDAGNWPLDINYDATGGVIQINHRFNISAGTPTVTWTINTGTWTGWVWCAEVSGLDASGTITTGFNSEVVNSDNHICSSTNLTGTDVFVIGGGVLSGNVTSTAAGATYTIATSLSSNRHLIQYKVTASQNDDGPWTSVGTDRAGEGAMAVFPAPSAPAGFEFSWGFVGDFL